MSPGSMLVGRIERNLRAGKKEGANWRSIAPYRSILRTTVHVFARNGDATRPRGHTSPHAHARSLAAASPSPDAVLMRLAAQRSNVLGLHSGPTAVDGCASVNSIRSWVLCARSWVRSEAASAGGVPFEPHSRSLTAVQHRQRLQDLLAHRVEAVSSRLARSSARDLRTPPPGYRM